MNNKEVIYLAIPYTWNPKKSFKIACKVAADLMNSGYVVLSPISMSHPIADYMDESLRTSQGFWVNQDEPLLKLCSKMCIVNINTEDKSTEQLIEESKGIQSEIQICKEENKEIFYYEYNG